MTLPTEDVAALVASFRRLIAKPITEVAGIMCSRGEITALLDSWERSERALLTVQNAAKTIAAAHGTELEHLRQNASFDHSLRAEVESLRQHNSEMTDALLAAEARATTAEARIAGLEAALEPFTFGGSDRFERLFGDLPDDTLRSITIELRHLRRAREALSRQEGGR